DLPHPWLRPRLAVLSAARAVPGDRQPQRLVRSAVAGQGLAPAAHADDDERLLRPARPEILDDLRGPCHSWSAIDLWPRGPRAARGDRGPGSGPVHRPVSRRLHAAQGRATPAQLRPGSMAHPGRATAHAGSGLLDRRWLGELLLVLRR